MSQLLSIKTAPVSESEESLEIQPDVEVVVPAGTDPEAIKAAFQAIADIVSDLDSAKAGSRNSKADADRHQNIHDHAAALGAICHDHNCPAPAEGEEGGPPKRKGTATVAAAKKPAGKPAKAGSIKDASDTAEALGVPLDKLVEAVREQFYDMRTQLRRAWNIANGKDADSWYDWDDDEVPCCEAVYDGFAIARVQLAHFKVPFTIEDTGVVLEARENWEKVQQEWVAKSAELAALLAGNAHKREIGAVKAMGGNRLGNYLMVWGDEKNRDLYGEFFTPETKGLQSIFKYIGKLPALYQHAMDGVVKYDPVGTIDVLEIDEVGLWMETQLDLANEYSTAVQTLAKKKALGASSGALPGSRKVRPNGEIWQWAIMEGSFTPTPAEPRLRELGVDVVKSIYAECGIEFPEEALKSIGTGDEESRQATDEAAFEEEKLRLLELSLNL